MVFYCNCWSFQLKTAVIYFFYRYVYGVLQKSSYKDTFFQWVNYKSKYKSKLIQTLKCLSSDGMLFYNPKPKWITLWMVIQTDLPGAKFDRFQTVWVLKTDGRLILANSTFLLQLRIYIFFLFHVMWLRTASVIHRGGALGLSTHVHNLSLPSPSH